jgi:hypothetical protein
MGMDLASGRLAIAWEFQSFTGGYAENDILLDTLGGGQKRIAKVKTYEDVGHALFGPSIAGGWVYFGGFAGLDPTSFLARYSIARWHARARPGAGDAIRPGAPADVAVDDRFRNLHGSWLRHALHPRCLQRPSVQPRGAGLR